MADQFRDAEEDAEQTTEPEDNRSHEGGTQQEQTEYQIEFVLIRNEDQDYGAGVLHTAQDEPRVRSEELLFFYPPVPPQSVLRQGQTSPVRNYSYFK